MPTPPSRSALAALETYLEGELDARVTDLRVVANGLNLVIAVSTPTADPGFVVRRPTRLRGTYYMNSPAREYAVLRALEPTAVPAPAPVHFCADESVLGDAFMVVTHLDGEVVPLGSGLPPRFRDADARAALPARLIDTLAAVHDLDPGRFEDACDRFTPRERIERATDRFATLSRATGHEPLGVDAVADRLRREAPEPADATLVHGDYRPGNVLFTGSDDPRISGVLDWETASLGEALSDLGYLLLRWRDPDDPTPDLAPLEARYPDDATLRDLRETNRVGLAPFTSDPGAPDRDALLARYRDRTGNAVGDERYYRAQAAFLLALVWEDIHRCRLDAGEPSDRQPWVDYMLLLARTILDGRG